MTSYYTRKARRGELTPGMYDDCVLILDEVDALVVDEEPNEDFVYDVSWRPLERGMSVGRYVTELGRCLVAGEECFERHGFGDADFGGERTRKLSFIEEGVG